MGGRGSKSGLGGGSNKKFSYSVGGLGGSEKQKDWAQNIVDDAYGTINSNVHNYTKGIQKNVPDAKDRAAMYRDVGNQIESRLKTVNHASQIIDMRRDLSPTRIGDFVDQKLMQKKRMKAK